jgi:hypothetical protein
LLKERVASGAGLLKELRLTTHTPIPMAMVSISIYILAVVLCFVIVATMPFIIPFYFALPVSLIICGLVLTVVMDVIF